MNIFPLLLSVAGLCVFEVVSSLDNAVVNADVLRTMAPKWRKWFLVWGILFAVVLVRGVLPWLIVWLSTPGLGPWEAMTASFSSDPRVAEAMKTSAPYLLMGGGVFLVFLFLHWLFLDHKEFGLAIEKFFTQQGLWFFTLASILLTVIIWLALKKDPWLAFAASVGSSVFFLTHGFKEHAEEVEVTMQKNRNLSDISKLVYLEVLDATFSIDGVIGAFAFTMSVPIIILGNGLGALVVRQLTIKGVEKIRNYPYLKNGAMYSIFFLGTIMILQGFHIHIPEYVAPLMTFAVIGYFFFKSVSAKKKNAP